MDEFSKITWYKLTIQKYTKTKNAHRYVSGTNKKKFKKDTTTAPKTIKDPKTNLIKNKKDSENYKIYWGKWKLSKWRNTPCSWIQRLNIVKMVVPHKHL